MDQAVQDGYAKSFTGRLYAIALEKYVPLRLSHSSDKWNWGFTPQDDWLLAGGDAASIQLEFVFDSHTDDRLHFHISLPNSGYPAKKLGVSRNGYLGFYQLAQVIDYWKIEPLEMTDEGLICHLRDHQGHRVAALRDTPHHNRQTMYLLSATEGEILTFLLQRNA
ncbi:MAG TPA: hypothetical protein DCE25_04545 [Pseudomonas sp.]|nr:hypothetical protein [Pseudomonas sp.]